MEEQEEKLEAKGQEQLRSSNLFQHLEEGEGHEDAFEICDEEDEVNFGQRAANLEVREVFTQVRVQLQKIFND